jgi:MPBQ/MSBQ methyltransferase
MVEFNIQGDCEPNADGYDSLMYWPPLLEYYCHSDFVNYGYWEKETVNACQAAENLMERLLAWIPEKRGKILDVACGKGGTTKYLLKYYQAYQITGIDISAKQTTTAKNHFPGGAFLAMNAAELGFQDASFDNMISVESAFHFRTRETFLKEALRVLKPGGRLVLSDILLTREAEERRRFRTVQNFVPDPQAYSELIIRAGFSRVEVQEATEPCFHGAFWHLARLSHEKLLAREITLETLKNFEKRFFEFVPEMRHYLLACAIK